MQAKQKRHVAARARVTDIILDPRGLRQTDSPHAFADWQKTAVSGPGNEPFESVKSAKAARQASEDDETPRLIHRSERDRHGEISTPPAGSRTSSIQQST